MSCVSMEEVYRRLWLELAPRFDAARRDGEKDAWVTLTFADFERILAKDGLVITRQTARQKWMVALANDVFHETPNPKVVVVWKGELEDAMNYPLPKGVCVKSESESVCEEAKE